MIWFHIKPKKGKLIKGQNNTQKKETIVMIDAKLIFFMSGHDFVVI